MRLLLRKNRPDFLGTVEQPGLSEGRTERMAKNINRRTWKRLLAAVLCLVTVFSQLVDTALWGGGFSAYAADTSAPIALKKMDGSGKAFIYHSFKETKEFAQSQTYAFLTGVYDYEDAVSALGAGAILRTTTTLIHGNNCNFYIGTKYGADASAKIYVDVVTPGKDFDSCKFGGLYEVPNSGTPTEYRYFCRAGGAQNCGPYYAYTYAEESVRFTNVTAALNGIENQGSKDPADYTVTITYDGDKTKVLDPGSYTVSFKDPDTVTFVISDSVGNSITANFQSPLAIRYDGNSDAAANVPSTQAAWRGERTTLSSQKPTRDGYTFVNWKDADTNDTYSAGQSITRTTSPRLLAQWRDTQAPVIGYTPTQVMTGNTDAAVKAAVEAALTITDNEPVSECTVTVTVPANFTKTPGNKDVTVTVTDKAGNTATKNCTVYVSSYVSILKPTFTKSTQILKATLKNPGTDKVTASGFVWGVMNSPTLTVNNGKAATSSVVSVAGGTLSVTADNLQKGVTYYARAYITAGGVTYYSEEIKIGLDLPAYGTFQITNSGSNTFTVKRTGGTEGAQTVYYRTVNGSAVGGTHFKHQSGILTIPAGKSSDTITITEYGTNKAYTGKPATAYSNADRTYSVEIYRVTGGASLDEDAKSATRTIARNTSYDIDRSVYDTSERTIALDNNNKWVADHSGKGDWKIYFQNDRGKNTNQINFNVQQSINSTYLKATASGFYYRSDFGFVESTEGYQLAWISNHAPNSYGPSTITAKTAIPTNDSVFGSAYFTAEWETLDSGAFSLPSATGYKIIADSVHTNTAGGKVVSVKDDDSIEKKWVSFDINDTAHVWFASAGDSKDIWYMDTYKDYTRINDPVEPQLVAVAPMAGGTYRINDTFVVSLIFDEIVDEQNSPYLAKNNVKVNTSWGTAYYSGGVNTNVLYFTGKIAKGASEKLTVNSITGAKYIKDMCSGGTANANDVSVNKDTTATVNTAMPKFTVTANGITNGTGKATIKVTATQANTTSMRYAWSDSSTAPTAGWVTLSADELKTAKTSAGLPLSIRKEAGSGASNGKWYLHVMGFYDTTGASDYKTAMLDFGTAASPAAGSTPPNLTVSANNTSWATSRTISISATGAQTLKYRKSGASAWTTLNNTAKSVTVYANGYYTFLLTAGDETITRTVQVDRIDRLAPTASIGELTSASVESPKAGVYTKLVLPVTYADAGSGVKTVQYSWTNSTATPTSWTSKLSAGATTVTYTASESAPTAKYLHIKVTDNVNYTYTTHSAAYTVLSQSAVNAHTPTIAITGAPTKWTNDTATLSWTLSGYEGKNYEVILPDGKTSTDASGEVWARQNGDYTVTVRDLDYGGENSATITVDKLDYAPPTVTVRGNSDGWTQTDQTLTITAGDSQSGVGEMWYKLVSGDAETPTEGLLPLKAPITVSDEGKCYVYYKVYDSAGDTTDGIEREANKSEGFVPVQIDKTAPEITFGDYSAVSGMAVTVKGSKDGVSSSELASVTYVIKSGTKILKTGSAPTNGNADIDFTLTELPIGDLTVTVTATDAAGNRSEISKEISTDIVSVTITWGDLDFTYTDGAWNPKTHTYKDGSWDRTRTTITVKNEGTSKVYARVTYSRPDSSDSSVLFTVSGTTGGSLSTGESFLTYVHIGGKPAKALNKATIATLTVTLSDPPTGGE